MNIRFHHLAVSLALVVTVCVTFASAQTPAPTGVPRADEALTAVKAQFAPDKRLAVFDVKTSLQDGVLILSGLQFMGVPYLWGGTSSKGFDCSGFSRTAMRMNGIELPRDADQQAAQGTAVEIDDQLTMLRKGDLLFFGAKGTADRAERVTHVGIYVGNGEFLHASGLVRRNSLLPSSPIYSESLRARLLHMRRVLP